MKLMLVLMVGGLKSCEVMWETLIRNRPPLISDAAAHRLPSGS